MKPHRKLQHHAFTLIELMTALAASALLLSALYGVFSKAIHLRDDATARTRQAHLRARAENILRNDLRNAFISGGTLAAVLEGSETAQGSSFPGYLKFTTTTARDSEDEVAADVQQVEYFISTDPNVSDTKTGRLVRTVETDLLTQTRETPPEEALLSGVQSMEVTFFDGQDWKSSWQVTTDDKTLPQAIRVRLLPATESTTTQAAPILEVLVPWVTQPAITTQ